MQSRKLPFLPLKQLFTCEKTTLNVPWLQIIRNLSSLFLNHSQRMQSLGNILASKSYCKFSLRLARILIEQCFQFSVFEGFWPSFTRTVVNGLFTICLSLVHDVLDRAKSTSTYCWSHLLTNSGNLVAHLISQNLN